MTPAPADAAPDPRRWLVCGLLLLATTLNYTDRVALNQTAPRIKTAFNLTNAGYAELESGFAYAFGVGTLFCGWLVDRVSVRRVYPVVVLGWSAAGFATGYATGFEMLLVCRVVLGGFEAGNWPCGIRTVRDIMPPAERPLGNSLFQSGTAIGAILTPIIVIACLRYTGDTPDAWRLPFRLIGLAGLAWVFAWLVLVPKSLVERPPTPGPAASFWPVLADRRFWVLIVVIIGVNAAWHTMRVWLPLYLKERRGYSDDGMNAFAVAYYLAADIGSWTVGFATLYLAKRRGLDAARLLLFAICAGLVLVTLALPNLDDDAAIRAVLLVFGFGSLGLFPTYFALSQDLSARHQGKVTGLLGFLNAVVLAQMFKLEGAYLDRGKDYAGVLAGAGIPAAVAAAVLIITWPRAGKKPQPGLAAAAAGG